MIGTIDARHRSPEVQSGSGPGLLIVDDDPAFRAALGAAFRRRGYRVDTAGEGSEALRLATARRPHYIVLDLKLGEDSGLNLIAPLLQRAGSARLVVLTGYASLATAVEAVKRGAHDYLPKPVTAPQLEQALLGEDAPSEPPIPERGPSLKRLEWEQIQRVLHESGGNISAAARALGMHRRTLQRKLAKRPVRN